MSQLPAPTGFCTTASGNPPLGPGAQLRILSQSSTVPSGSPLAALVAETKSLVPLKDRTALDPDHEGPVVPDELPLPPGQAQASKLSPSR